MNNQILVVGSIGYDIIFSIKSDIRDEILVKKGKIAPISMMFTANNKQRYFGGTGGNISYGLGQLGLSPLLFSIVGQDFYPDYEQHLKQNNVKLRLKTDKKGWTATFYGISDKKLQQIGIWQPNSYGQLIEQTSLSDTISFDELSSVRYAIFSPGTANSTLNHMIELRNRVGQSAKIIFDPSQALTVSYSDEILNECLTHADILIGNEIEIYQIQNIFNISFDKIFQLGVQYIIETVGSNGVNIYTQEGTKHIDATPCSNVVETTGAGDAFRAGLLFGLYNKYSIEKACSIGNFVASKSVQEVSGQLFNIDENELDSFIKKL